jgi:superfamily II DNA or RNA helicase
MSDVRLEYDRGTLLLDGLGEGAGEVPEGFVADPRVGRLRAPGACYRSAFAALHLGLGGKLVDQARAYRELALAWRSPRTPYPHQLEAVQAWLDGRRRGLVVLPTGSGKTFVAELALFAVQRSTLVVVPTLDLMNQWYGRLLAAFDLEDVGLVGGGYYDVRDVTVTTYDSFQIHAERLGNRFALLVYDEVHHLPSPTYSLAASCYIAPFRLGLTATPEREDEGARDPYAELVGPILYRKQIKELAGEHLSEYETRRVVVELTPQERELYESERALYLAFLRQSGIQMSSRSGWSDFIRRSAGSKVGRRAMLAYRAQRRVALACEAKLRTLEVLLTRHADDRTLVFTNDNETAYRISAQFLIPIITHQTPVKERQAILEGIRTGTYRAIVTSKVLNEGVDIPTANVAVVLSGTSTVREHVQRLGRILRRAEGKHAVLYEVIANDTMESHVSERRRDHDAYR